MTLDPLPAFLNQLKPSGVDWSLSFDEPASKDLRDPGPLLGVGALLACVLQEPELAFDMFLIRGDVGINFLCASYSIASWPFVVSILEWVQSFLLIGLGVALLQFFLLFLIGFFQRLCVLVFDD